LEYVKPRISETPVWILDFNNRTTEKKTEICMQNEGYGKINMMWKDKYKG